jgi:hypothetical protein
LTATPNRGEVARSKEDRMFGMRNIFLFWLPMAVLQSIGIFLVVVN